MGLLLSVLVVCVGVLEAISCVRHVQHGYLHSWAAARIRPMLHERPRGKPKDEQDGYSSDESSDELSRILLNGGGVNVDRNETRGYGLTPILTEHRRKTPILLDDEPKYVANNIDECYTGSRDSDALSERFRPISPSDLDEALGEPRDEPQDEPLDESYVSQSGKFLEVPPDDSPLQRSSSEETLHDSESGDGKVLCPVDERDIEFQIDEPLVADDDVELSDDPVFNLVSAAAYILRTEGSTRRSPPAPGGTTSSCRPLNVDVTARIPTPQTHRESIPFDLAAAHVSSGTSRPETPTTPRKSRADISWPVFHPEPVIKRPVIAHTDLARGESIEEDLVDEVPQPEGVQEDHCSKVVAGNLAATPFVTIPGCGAPGGARRNLDDPRPSACKSSVDRFGRITCEPRRKRRGSLERAQGGLKDSVMSKSLPDFFFEENMTKKSDVTPDDDDQSVSLGKDITPKESSIKRRRSYREKKRSTWTPSRSRDKDVTEPVSEEEKPKKSLFEIDNESMDDFVGPSDTEVVSKVEAIKYSVLTPVEVLHHSEVRPKSGVFATPTQQQRTRLKKPAKAESFEEAGPEISLLATPTNKPVDEAGPESSLLATPTNKQVEEAGPEIPLMDTPTNNPVKQEVRPESTAIATPTKKLVKQQVEPGNNIIATPTPKPVKQQVEPENNIISTPTKKPVKQQVEPESNAIAKPVEEAGPSSGGLTQNDGVTRQDTSKITVEQVESKARSMASPAPMAPPAPVAPPASTPDETNANEDQDDEDDEVDENDDVTASESDTSNVNQPQESSEPAPFWVRPQ